MNRLLLVTSFAALCATSTVAQAQLINPTRGTVEFGAFGSLASFDNSLSLKTGYGGGGRVGIYLDPRVSMEFEDAEMRATRPNGLRDVNVGILSGRLVVAPVTVGRLSFLMGAGAGVSTETNFMHTYGVDGLVGAKLAISDNAAIRVDGVLDFLANQEWKTYRSVRMGLSLYRRPAKEIISRTVVQTRVDYRDNVDANELRRLRDRDAALGALRDSLAAAPQAAVTEPAGATVYFDFDQAVLTSTAREFLNQGIAGMQSSSSEIHIIGYTDLIGTSAYNMALGQRRASVVKDYLVSRGVDSSRITTTSMGEQDAVTTAPGREAQAPNRRAVFRLLLASTPK